MGREMKAHWWIAAPDTTQQQNAKRIESSKNVPASWLKPTYSSSALSVFCSSSCEEAVVALEEEELAAELATTT